MTFEELLATFATIPNLLTMVAAGGLVSTLALAVPKLIKNGVWARFEPFATIILCSIFVWVPGARPDLCNGEAIPGQCDEIGIRIMSGIILGLFAAWAYKAFKQTVLGKDERIKPSKIKCVHCKKVSLLAHLEDKCPYCGQPPYLSDHETMTKLGAQPK